MRWVVVMTLCSALLAGCNDQQCVCTLEFKSVEITVLNLQGQPEAGVQVRTTVERTGAVLELHQMDHPVGVYTILDDSHVGQLQFQGDRLQVVGSKNGLGFTVEIVARPDGPCRCHIDKVSGPEVVTLQ